MRYGSVCSGIEAASVAWHPLGWEPAWFSEIEPFPCAVLNERFPNVPNYGDFTQMINPNHEVHRGPAIDVLVGGTPCQDFSVAGLRAGIGGERGGLTLDFLRLAQSLRPRWIVWENVPGVLSSDGGRALGAFVGGLAELGYGFAWRVLDAQYVRVDGYSGAVPQRRRRIFVVGHSSGDARRAAAVLLEPEGVRGNPAPRREARKGVAAAAAGGFEVCGNERAAEVGVRTIAFTTRGRTGGLSVEHQEEMAYALKNPGAGGRSNDRMIATANGNASGLAVRRLTPVECERLQGFPDNWTAIPWRGKSVSECPDGPRYKVLGNSMACNVMRWIGRRIELVDKA